MINKVSTPLTYKNLRSLRKHENILGILTDDVCDEHFMFYSADRIKLKDSTLKDGLALRGGAIGGYYFRRVYPNMDFMSDLDFQRKGYHIEFKVYSNDTCDGSSYGLSYSGAIVFPRDQLANGVRELFDLIRKQSENGIVKELTPEELSKVQRLIVEDLRDHKHTRKARIRGMEMDDFYGM